tara:strand:+ start:561 stop:770 length:210 start_codon:yes stop_codon:yes gene_type:complete
LRLLDTLASRPSPYQPVLAQCIEALRPCVFARASTEAAAVAPLEWSEAASEGVMHISVSAKLSAEVAKL